MITKIRKRQIVMVLILLTLFSLLLPHFIRLAKQDYTLTGPESYYHARIAEQITDQGFIFNDEFVFESRPYVFDPYDYTLAIFSLFLGAVSASKVLPLVLGLISAFIFYLILRKLKVNILETLFIVGIWLLSPVFVKTFFVSDSHSLALLLTFLGFFLFMNKKKTGFWSIIIFLIIPFFSIVYGIISAAIILAYSFTLKTNTKKQMLKRAYIFIFFMLSIILFYYGNFFFKYGIPQSITSMSINLLQRFITDLGGMYGFSIFTLLLAGIGVAFTWKLRKQYYFAYVVFFLVLLYSLFDNTAVVYSNIAVCFIAGVALAKLARIKWELKQVRDLSILILVCGILFSGVSYTIRLGDLAPNSETVDALHWLEEHKKSDDLVVFSHYSKGFVIEQAAGLPVVMDAYFDYTPNAAQRYADSKTIFDSRDLKTTRQLLTKYNVRFILMTNDMTDGLVWDKPEEGLDFMLRNKETFNKKYSNSYAEIWEYIYEEE